MAELRELIEATFDEEITGSPVPVVVDFWAEWCGPCHAVAPILHEIAVDHADALRIFTVDADAHPALAARYSVMSLPTLLVFDRRQGVEPVLRLVGARGKRHLLAELDDVLGNSEPAVR